MVHFYNTIYQFPTPSKKLKSAENQIIYTMLSGGYFCSYLYIYIPFLQFMRDKQQHHSEDCHKD